MPSRPHRPKISKLAGAVAGEAAVTRITVESVSRPVDSLLKWHRSQSKHRQSTDDHLYLVVTLKKIAHGGKQKSFRIPLPNPIVESACIVVDDSPKSKLRPNVARAAIDSNVVPCRIEILSLAEIKSLDDRRGVSKEYNLLFCDRRIMPQLLRLISVGGGNKKGKVGKKPVEINVGVSNWIEVVKEACQATIFQLGSGTCSVVKVGKVSQGRKEIVENLIASITGAVGSMPKKWKNVKALHIKLSESLALPVYEGVPKASACKKTKEVVKSEMAIARAISSVDDENECEGDEGWIEDVSNWGKTE